MQHRCFPGKFCENFKSTYFEEHLQTSASGGFDLRCVFRTLSNIKLEGLTRIWNASNDDASKFQKGKKIVILYWTFCSQCNYNNFFSGKKNLLKERNQI